MPPRNLLPCKSDDREQRAVVPGPQGPLFPSYQGQAPELLTPAAACTPGPRRETPAWRRSRRSPAWAPHPQLLRACSSPTPPSAPPAQSRQAAVSPSEGYWAAVPPSPGTCLGRGHPCPPRRQPHPRGSPTRRGIPDSAPLAK